MSDTYDLDRATREAENIDALGKKWNVVVNRQNGLSHARPEPDRADAVIPKELEGKWTKPSLLKKQIQGYVKSTWDIAEKAVEKARRKAEAAKEAAKDTKKEK